MPRSGLRVTASMMERLSLAEVIRHAQPGDVIELAPGRYPGGIWVDRSGEPERPIVIRAIEGPGTVVIEGGEETLNIGGGAHHLVFEGLELRGASNNVLHIQDGAHHIVLRDLVVHHAGDDGDGIKVNQARDIVIERVECHHPGRRPDRPGGNPAQECIDLVDVQRVVVQDCYLHDGGNMLLYAKGGSRDVIFQRNVIVGQSEDAIDPCVGLGAVTDPELLHGRPYEVEDIVFRNNVVANCRAGAVGVYDARRAWVVNNTLVDNGPVAIEFRAGNGPRQESRDVHVINNLVVDTKGSMRSAIVQRAHPIHQLEVHHNLYWNGGQTVPRHGLLRPIEEPGVVRDDPRIEPIPPTPALRTEIVRRVLLKTNSPAIDRGTLLRGPAQVQDDLLGRRRPYGATIDLGAVEFGATEQTPSVEQRPSWPSEAVAIDSPTVVPVMASKRTARRGQGCAGCSPTRSDSQATTTAVLAMVLCVTPVRRCRKIDGVTFSFS